MVLMATIQFVRFDAILRQKVNETFITIEGEQNTPIMNEMLGELTIVYDESYDYMIKLKDNIEKTLDYMYLPYKSIGLKEVKKEDLSGNIILALENIEEIQIFEQLLKCVEEGGKLFLAFRLEGTDAFKAVSRQMGILELGEFKETMSIELLDEFLIGGKGTSLKGEYLSNSVVSMKLAKDVKVHAETSKEEESIPLLWSKSYGNGEIFYFNGTMLSAEFSRGIIASVIRQMAPTMIYPIINAKIDFIDDFPSPLPEGYDETLQNDYNRNIRAFYEEIWWPDMIGISYLNGIKYTGVAIGNYDDEVDELEKTPILLTEDEMSIFVKELIINEGELGIHGYNHQPLTLKPVDPTLNYKPWKDFDTMLEGISKLTTYINEQMPCYTMHTYVPPSNIVSEEGIDAIIKANPDIRIIASLYEVGQGEEGYKQELQVDERGVIHLPRLISGYEYTGEMKWKILMGINIHGYFSHFMHPDDLLDIERSKGKNWGELKQEYAQMQRDVISKYPWIKSCTATEGANQLLNYTQAKLIYQMEENRLVIENENFLKELSFIVTSEKSIKNVIGGTFHKVGDNLYVVNMQTKKCEIIY